MIGWPAAVAAAVMVMCFRGVAVRLAGRVRRPLRFATPAGAGSPAGPALPRGRALQLPLRVPGALPAALDAAGVDIAPASVWVAWLAGGSTTAVLAIAGAGPGAGLAALVVVGGVPVALLHSLRHRGAARYDAALAPALEAVARSLRSGAGLRRALAEAAAGSQALHRDLARVVAEAERGAALVDALDAWSVRRPLPGVRLTVAALALSIEAGGANARAVDGVAATLRQRRRADDEARALGAQARLSAGVIAVAPVVFAGLSAVIDPAAGRFLFRSATGGVLLVAGIALDLVGGVWMARLARVRPQ